METYIETGAVCQSRVALEAFDMETAFKTLSAKDAVGSETKETLLTVHQQLLPFAADEYGISAKLQDYVLVPTVIMPTCLPNRNQVAFPRTELAKFKPDYGCLAYQTWRGKPTHLEHDHKDIRRAKGMIFDSFMRPLAGTSLFKVVCLLGFDRTKDPALVDSILKGRINAYSMGATCTGYTCSLDGLPPGQTPYLEESTKRRGAPGRVDFKIVNGNLAYWRAHNPVGFEVSAVSTPAYASATNGAWFTLQ